ncbi:MAG: hypothetical protein KC910_01845, partial [Candidatus Eremiobacteraeota bacterium]|nr:hypothetical protein [Candidatus Eremiobacteraeota bacterium]
MKVLYAYESAPGEAGHPPLEWPRQSRLVLERDRDTVLLFVHPKCPCTVASIEEMQRLLACLPARPKVYVLLTTPVGVAPGWEEGLLQRMVTGSVSLDPIVDRGEVETKRFRVFTSGQVVVYDSQGRLQFCGGVTPSRGH